MTHTDLVFLCPVCFALAQVECKTPGCRHRLLLLIKGICTPVAPIPPLLDATKAMVELCSAISMANTAKFATLNAQQHSVR